MINLLIDVVLVFWMLLFGGMTLLPIITGARRQTGDLQDRVIILSTKDLLHTHDGDMWKPDTDD